MILVRIGLRNYAFLVTTFQLYSTVKLHRERGINPSNMTAQLPDPRDFKDWEDAFQYPLPAVRTLEQQLRSNAVENREKLRTLVGYVPCKPHAMVEKMY